MVSGSKSKNRHSLSSKQEAQERRWYTETAAPSVVLRKRRLEEGNDVRHNAATSSSSMLPRCEPFPLTVTSEVPIPQHGHQNHRHHHPYSQIVIAHRGASAHLPEHSLEAYRLALELGADYIEPDLVATKDGYLVAMHSLDLTQTTNVVQVFGSSKNKTLSLYKQKQQKDTATDASTSDSYGYWVYDFTLEELTQLRLNQRLGGGGEERSTAFDGLLTIPTLTEILELLNDWNENVQHLWYYSNSNRSSITDTGVDGQPRPPPPQQKQHYYPPPPRGLYAELKDFPWLLQDANIDLLDLLFEHISNEQNAWQTALLQHMCATKRLRWGEYKLPPLVLQSFEAEVLKRFTIRWEELANSNNGNDNENNNNTTTTFSPSLLTHEVQIDGNSTARIPLPTPPTIVLVSHDKCRDEAFWYEMGNSYRNIISGIGPDKMCFFREQPQSISSSTEEAPPPLFQYEPTVMEQATKLDWVVHPWTERPELEFFATTTRNNQRQRQRRQTTAIVTPFETVLEEIVFLKCTVGVHGVFSESVNSAVRALSLVCPASNNKNGNTNTNAKLCPSNNNKSNSFSLDTKEIPLGPVVLFSFFLGVLVALVVLKYCCELSLNSRGQRQQQQQRRAPRQRGRRSSHLPPHSALPATDEDDDDAVDGKNKLVLNENDHEML